MHGKSRSKVEFTEHLKNEFFPFIKKNFLLDRLNYHFKDQELLFKAFCHSSFTHELSNHGIHIESNERLEFLGDSILNFVVGLELFKLYPKSSEGDLTIRRGQRVGRTFLAQIGKYLDLQNLILLGRGEFKQKAYLQERMMANTVEALIGAIFFDSSFESAQKVILAIFRNGEKEGHLLGIAEKGQVDKDPKSLISEMMMKKGREVTYYDINPEKNEQEDFHVALLIDGKAILSGQGPSKKRVQKELAKEFIDNKLYQHFVDEKREDC